MFNKRVFNGKTYNDCARCGKTFECYWYRTLDRPKWAGLCERCRDKEQLAQDTLTSAELNERDLRLAPLYLSNKVNE